MKNHQPDTFHLSPKWTAPTPVPCSYPRLRFYSWSCHLVSKALGKTGSLKTPRKTWTKNRSMNTKIENDGWLKIVQNERFKIFCWHFTTQEWLVAEYFQSKWLWNWPKFKNKMKLPVVFRRFVYGKRIAWIDPNFFRFEETWNEFSSANQQNLQEISWKKGNPSAQY